MESTKPSSSHLGTIRYLFAAAALFAAAGCGGGGSGDSTGSPSSGNPPAPAPAPTPAPPPPAPAPPPVGSAGPFYFSDCQSGASAGCILGSNANAGTSASAPKQNLSGFNVNALPAGTQLLFARGGAWSGGVSGLRNLNATTSAPLTFAAYTPSSGATARPLWRGSISTGGYNENTWHGGYVFRGIKVDGNGSSDRGVFVHSSVRGLLLDDVEITRWRTGIEAQQSGAGLQDITVRSSYIHRNTEQGFIGEGVNLTLESNLFEANNPSGSIFFHGIYVGGRGSNLVVRNNRFINNSVVNGVCMGGNFTVHGQWEGGLIEGNTVEVPASQASCYGFSMNPGYSTAEWMRNFVVRNNVAVDTGCGFCMNSVPGAVVEGNRVFNINVAAAGISIGLGQPDAGDAATTGAAVRNNTACYQRDSGQGFVATGGGVTASDNQRISGAAATTGACAR